MAFRERTAWLTLVTLLTAYGVYFAVVGPAVEFGRNGLVDVIWSFGAVAAAHAFAMTVGSIAIAVASRREATAPADERDRAVARRGSTAAYYVLLIGVVWVGMVMPFGEPPWLIVNAALAVVVAAEATRYILILVSYRRGWHG